MASEKTDELNPVQQVVVGFALGVSAILVLRVAGGFIVRTVTTMGAKMAAKHIAGAIVNDVAIGTVPVLHVGTAVGVKEIAITLVTTSLWMIGGPAALKDPVFDALKIPHGPFMAPDFVFDQPLSPHSSFKHLRSRGGAIQAITYNAARIDP